VKQWTPLVKSIANRYLRRLGRWYEFSDLVSVGLAQLWVASGNYDDTMGAQFGTYAYYAIYRAYEAILEYLYKNKRRDALRAVSYDEAYEDGAPVREIPAPDLSPYDALDLRRDVRAMEQALRALRPNDRRIILGRFMEGEKLGELATELGVTKQRALQIEQRALRRLRRELAPVLSDREGGGPPLSCKQANIGKQRATGKVASGPRIP